MEGNESNRKKCPPAEADIIVKGRGEKTNIGNP